MLAIQVLGERPSARRESGAIRTGGRLGDSSGHVYVHLDETHPIFERNTRFWPEVSAHGTTCAAGGARRFPRNGGPSGTSCAGRAIRRIRSMESNSLHSLLRRLCFTEANTRSIAFHNPNMDKMTRLYLLSRAQMSRVQNEDKGRLSYLRRGPRPMLFSNSDTSSPWRRTPVFAKMLRRCMRAVVRRIPMAAQHSSSDKPSIR